MWLWRLLGVLIALSCGLALGGCGPGVERLLHHPAADRPLDYDWSIAPHLDVTPAIAVRGVPGAAFNLHPYLHFDGRRFFMMWTSTTRDEAEAGGVVRWAVSDDGLNWTAMGDLTPGPPAGQRYIARGFWVRDGQLLALAVLSDAADMDKSGYVTLAFEPPKGPSLVPGVWREAGPVLRGAAMNYPPKKLEDGRWLETSRDWRAGPAFVVNGGADLTDWRKVAIADPPRRLEWRLWPETPASRRPEGEGWKSWLRAPRPHLTAPKLDEPVWWRLPDGRLRALARDNSHGGRLYTATADASGEHWSRWRVTNMPDATSKVAALKVSEGLYVLASNPRPTPRERNPLVLTVSSDGSRFDRMVVLRDAPTRRRIDGQRKTPGYQYADMITVGDWLFVAYARNKEDIEVVRLPLASLKAVPATPAGSRR